MTLFILRCFGDANDGKNMIAESGRGVEEQLAAQKVGFRRITEKWPINHGIKWKCKNIVLYLD